MKENSPSAVSFRTSAREGEWRLPDWPVIDMLPGFWERYPSKRFPNQRLFVQHVVECAARRHEQNCCRDAEEWANLVFTSAMVRAARRLRAESRGDPMAHFLWALDGATSRRELSDGATVNLHAFREFVAAELGMRLGDLLGDPAGPNGARAPRRAAAAAAVVAAAASVTPAPVTSTTPPPAGVPSEWRARARVEPVVLSAETTKELERQARLEAEANVGPTEPCREDVLRMRFDESLARLTRAAVEDEGRRRCAPQPEAQAGAA